MTLLSAEEREQAVRQRERAPKEKMKGLLKRLTAAGGEVFAAKRKLEREAQPSQEWKWQRPEHKTERQEVKRVMESIAEEARIELPWDILRGKVISGVNEFDVLQAKNAERVALMTATSLLQHWAPQCRTFSRLRDRPIPGVARHKQPRPCRDADHPKGLPEVMALKNDLPAKVQGDTDMAVLALTQCALAAATGRFFILENPTHSWLWELPEAKALMGMAGVRKVLLHNCAFGGSRRKATTLLTNLEDLEAECGVLCGETRADAPCPFSGVKHVKWAPAVGQDGHFDTPSGGESEYPVRLCEAMARAAMKLKETMEADGLPLPPSFFIEVFSGPNAPLTQAVARACATVPRD